MGFDNISEEDVVKFGLLTIGYCCKDISHFCQVIITDKSKWIVDTRTRPISIFPSEARRDIKIDLEISLSMRSLGHWLFTLDPQKIFEHGNINVQGINKDEFLVKIRGEDRFLGYYDATLDFLPDPNLCFMNNGYYDERKNQKQLVLPECLKIWKYSINLIEHILEDIQTSGKSVLDIGSGRGGTCKYLDTYKDVESVKGVDIVLGNVDFCNRHNESSKTSFIHGSSMELPIKDSSIDVVTNIESSHCYPNKYIFINEVKRVLVSGGVFCWTDALPTGEIEEICGIINTLDGRIINKFNITREVINAMERSKELLFKYFKSLVSEQLANAWVVDMYLNDFDRIYNDYKSGVLNYYSLQVLWDK